jgi:hypothetical protein
MMRAVLSIASAVLVITSVVHGANVTKFDAKTDAQIHLYPFTSDLCAGSPTGSPLELRQGQCVNFLAANSVKPMLHPEHSAWINEVNELRTYCKLETFRAAGCPPSKGTVQYLNNNNGDLPKDLNRCFVGSESVDGDPHSLYSARFVCGKVENPELLCTSTIEHTFYSMDATGEPHHSVLIATYSGTLTASGHVARSVTVDKPKQTPKRGFKNESETKGVWLLHPWSKSVQCYQCYLKKKHDYRNIECRFGLDYPAVCDDSSVDANGQPLTSRTTTTATTMAMTTTHATYYIMKSDGDVGATDSDFSDSSDFSETDIWHGQTQRRSWHKPVKFSHPFLPDQYLCADAEWEKRGRPESYIKVQHCHICTDKDRKDSEWIGLPEIVTSTKSEVTTTTNTINHTHTLNTRDTTQAHDQL